MIDEIYEVTKHEYNALISELHKDVYEKVIATDVKKAYV